MRVSRTRLGAVVAVVAALFIVAGAASAAGKAVSIAGFAFNPGTIKVHAGDTITWTNQDAASHTATGDGFDTGTIGTGASASVTFDTAGTFAYHCSIHSSMTGTVVVEAAASGGGGNGGGGQPTTPPSDTAFVPPTSDTSGGLGSGVPAILAVAGLLGASAVTRRLARRRAD
jgi:plastocyanin